MIPPSSSLKINGSGFAASWHSSSPSSSIAANFLISFSFLVSSNLALKRTASYRNKCLKSYKKIKFTVHYCNIHQLTKNLGYKWGTKKNHSKWKSLFNACFFKINIYSSFSKRMRFGFINSGPQKNSLIENNIWNHLKISFICFISCFTFLCWKYVAKSFGEFFCMNWKSQK